jgi:hypothetical protein
VLRHGFAPHSDALRWLTGAYVASAALAVASCVVSFNDYPIGGVGGGGSTGTGGKAGKGEGGSTGGSTTTALGGSGGSSGTDDGKDGKGDTGGSGGAAPTEDVIDDFEDGDYVVLPTDGRVGRWYTMNDGTGTQTPAQGYLAPSMLSESRDGSQMALHTQGDGFDDWGALIRADFNHASAAEPINTYDASTYSGIRFWGKSGDADSYSVRVVLLSTDTDSGDDHFGNDLTFTPEWQEFTLPFDMMQQEVAGPLPSIDPSELMGFQIALPPGSSFDVWIDDLRFYE